MTEQSSDPPERPAGSVPSYGTRESPDADRRPMLALLAANVIAQVGKNMTIVWGWFVPQTDSVHALTSLGHPSRLRG